eukprot:446367-Pleurochrysis_carterae.AAC.1
MYKVATFASPSKAELKELHAAELDLDKAESIVDFASAQADKTGNAAAKVKKRGRAHGALRGEGAARLVEASRTRGRGLSHEKAVKRLNTLKASAHAAKHAAEARAATAAKAKGEESKKAKEAQALTDELQERVDELEKELEGGACGRGPDDAQDESAAEQSGTKWVRAREVGAGGGGHDGGCRLWSWSSWPMDPADDDSGEHRIRCGTPCAVARAACALCRLLGESCA